MQRTSRLAAGQRPACGSPASGDARPLNRAAFTLVEMLVALALVVLMMSMFAEIFQIAAGSISTQRGIMENDQRARSLQTILKADLDKRTFRLVEPWLPSFSSGGITIIGEDASRPEVEAVNRRGYFYLSENNPDDDTDDVLQFTMMAGITTRNKDTSVYYGKATPLGSLSANINQPDADDGWPNPNSVATSMGAEVAYFLRNGNLYRRMLLLRQPLDIADPPLTQPTTNASPPQDMFAVSNGIYGGGQSNFWNDFDFSAHFNPTKPTSGGADFHGVEDLDNSGQTGFFPVGKPMFRFGHNHNVPSPPNLAGQPREYADVTTNPPRTQFIGRFTQEETSNLAFQYPFNASTSGNPNPMDGSSSTTPYTLNPQTKIVTAFQNGPRRGEDLLMPNVLSFDVKVWDDILQQFVDVGYSPGGGVPTGDYAQATSRNMHMATNIIYGPQQLVANTSPQSNRLFDTWHPELDISTAITGNDPPPFRPIRYRPAYITSAFMSATTKPVWSPGSHSPGEIVFPGNTPPPPPFGNQAQNGYRFYYRCVIGGQSAPNEPSSTNSPPNPWPTTAGMRVVDGEVMWEAVDNWKPMKAIQIMMRVRDASTDQIRQLTIVHSLID